MLNRKFHEKKRSKLQKFIENSRQMLPLKKYFFSSKTLLKFKIKWKNQDNLEFYMRVLRLHKYIQISKIDLKTDY